MSTNKTNQAVTETKQKVKAEKKAVQERSEKKVKRARVRIFPIWLRIILITILCAFALTAGVMIGYGVVGDGVPTDALKVETWRHIIDIVTKE